MRREWQGLKEWAGGLAVFWSFAWLIVALVLSPSPRKGDGALWWLLVGWFGPYALVVLVLFVVIVLPLLWDERPRRVWRPIKEDLREHEGKR